jgi:hypothetical protein
LSDIFKNFLIDKYSKERARFERSDNLISLIFPTRDAVFLSITTCKTHACQPLNLALIILDGVQGSENYGLAYGNLLKQEK